MERPSSSNEPAIDPAQPLRGVVVCCTNIPPNRRTELEEKIQQLGGTHKYDLTADVTHLVVGHYDTPKYRHVAKLRPDVKPMSAAWVDTLTALWTDDSEIDFAAVEKEGQLLPLETSRPDPGTTEDTHQRLVCSITGFHEPELRNAVIAKITENGGVYTPDLDRKSVTHLIAREPEGKKYKAARRWNVHTVSLRWLDESLERGMILDESFFDPTLPPDEQGKGAWVRLEERKAALGKRQRPPIAAEQGQRKLRKTASMKLSSQRDTLWGDILRRNDGAEPGGSAATVEAPPAERVEVADSGADLAAKHPAAADAGVFATCTFVVSGFVEWMEKVLKNTIESLEGVVCRSIDEMVERNDYHAYNRYLIVPQESQPDTHPRLSPEASDLVDIVTEFFIEKCLHKKTLCDPNEHILGRPFPQFPIGDFEHLAICTGGFKGVDLNHVEKTVKQLGAKYATRLNEATSVLVCTSLEEQRKEKLKFALENGIPVVGADWLWECVSTGFNVPLERFLFSQLRQDPALQPKTTRDERKPMQRTRSEPARALGSRPSKPGMDDTAFDTGSLAQSAEKPSGPRTKPESMQFHTARTHQLDSFGAGTVAPLTESTNAGNNQPPSPKTAGSKPASTARSPENEDEAPPQGDEDDDATASGRSSETLETPKEPEPDHDAQAELKRKQDEQKAAERADLASKIMASKISGLDGARTPTASDAETAPPEEDASAKPHRRRKGIFGRAVSNVSAASNNSHESVPGGADHNKQGPAAPFDERDGGLLRTRSEGAAAADAGGKPNEGDLTLFSSTQIGYRDPEGAKLKAEMLREMEGEVAEAPAAKPACPADGVACPPVIETGPAKAKATAATAKTRQRATRRKGF